MNKIGITIMATLAIFTAYFKFQLILDPRREVEQGLSEQILQSTFQISLYPAGGGYYDQGLASLVSWEGKNVLITHNHWTVFKSLEKTQFLNAYNEVLLTLDRRSFLRLILHSDPGTLILEAPAGLGGVPASLAPAIDLQPGDHLLVAHQTAPGSSPVEVRPATVQGVDQFLNYPAILLVNLDYSRTIDGDSGGGIWYQGQLIGNTWAAYDVKSTNLWDKTEQFTIGSRIPLKTLALMSENLPVDIVSEDQGGKTGKHE